MHITRIKKLLQQTARGKILNLNMDYAQKNKHFPNDKIINNLIELIVKDLSASENIRHYVDDPEVKLNASLPVEKLGDEICKILENYLGHEDAFNEILRSMGKVISNNREKYLFLRKQILPCDKKTFSCIKSAKIFADMINFEQLSKSAIEFDSLLRFDPSLTEDQKNQQQTEIIDFFNEICTQPEKYLKQDTKFWHANHKFIWLTDTKAIEQIKATNPSSEFANVARDILGLVHYGSNELLIECYTPFENLENIEKALPTFIEASEHTRFKACLDSMEEDCCGQTVDLQLIPAYKLKDDKLDGAPEFLAYTETMNLQGWYFRIIGFTTRAGEDIPVKDADIRYANVLEKKYATY